MKKKGIIAMVRSYKLLQLYGQINMSGLLSKVPQFVVMVKALVAML